MQNMCPEERCHTVAVVGIRHVVADSAHLWRSIAHGNARTGGAQHPQVIGAVPKGNRILRRDAQVPRECKQRPALIRIGGGLCELGFFINGGDATINPHFDLCSKEINLVGSWVYNLRDYATTFDFLKRAKAIGLPMSDLITHKFPLEQINEALETNLAMTGLKIAIVNK